MLLFLHLHFIQCTILSIKSVKSPIKIETFKVEDPRLRNMFWSVGTYSVTSLTSLTWVCMSLKYFSVIKSSVDRMKHLNGGAQCQTHMSLLRTQTRDLCWFEKYHTGCGIHNTTLVTKKIISALDQRRDCICNWLGNYEAKLKWQAVLNVEAEVLRYRPG